ncbi:hypothetical protein [Ruegeria sp. HKCCA4633]|uniref:hypothetical protein n=1 Tax=Ruegeria sp. HKCCA4633 TaxID=2682983 RepID=UPI001583A91E|nr:hypothetical protein [Ruegeria sp. HKCCA4633]
MSQISEDRPDQIRIRLRRKDHFSGNILTPSGYVSCVRVSMCRHNSTVEVAKFLAARKEFAA